MEGSRENTKRDWAAAKKFINPEELRVMNKYRKKFGMVEA